MQDAGHAITTLPQKTATLGNLQVRVHDSWQDMLPALRLLERDGVASFYQTEAWCAAWLETRDVDDGIAPIYVVGQTAQGHVKFLLPFQLRTTRRLRVIEWLTWPDCGYGFGLYEKAFVANAAAQWFAEHFENLINLLPHHDVTSLRDMPESMRSFSNPLNCLATTPSANRSHVMQLQPDFEMLLAGKRSAETRRSMRKRDAKLAGLGALEFSLPDRGAESHAVLDDMFRDQQLRLGEAGVGQIFSERQRRFIHRLMDATHNGAPVLRPYWLQQNGKTLSVMLGGIHAKTYWAMISSLAQTGALRHSPGDHALRAMIAALCDDGIETLDFSAGDAAYKLQWADRTVQLNHYIRGRTTRGIVAAAMMRSKEAVKRLVKSNSRLRALAFTLRRAISGRKAS